jgi:hypothetical protein
MQCSRDMDCQDASSHSESRIEGAGFIKFKHLSNNPVNYYGGAKNSQMSKKNEA